MRVPLIATKDMTYATRRLKAGDSFEASNTDARILRAIRKAEDAPSEPKQEKDPLTSLRAEYTEKVGKRPYHGWDLDELHQRIADSNRE